MADTNLNGFIGNLNKIVQDYFADFMNTYDVNAFRNYTDDVNNVYGQLIKTKGPDIIKVSNLYNYLSEWERGFAFGGYIRALGIGAARPIDPPAFAQGSSPDNGIIMKPDISASYHPLRARMEFGHTSFNVQLRDAFNNPEELGAMLAGTMGFIGNGANRSLFRLYKELFHKFYGELSTANKTKLTSNELPATITSKEDAIKAVNTIRGYVNEYLFGEPAYSAQGLEHMVPKDRMRLYLDSDYASAIVDYLKLDHYMHDNPEYSNTAGNISLYLGVPTRILNDFGGILAYGAETTPGDPTTAPLLYPIYDVEGAVTGTYSDSRGGTNVVDVASWRPDTTYNIKAVLTEDDFGNVFTDADELHSIALPRGGGYINTFRYIDKLLVANPHSNTIYFT